jgi:hypothetical protein
LLKNEQDKYDHDKLCGAEHHHKEVEGLQEIIIELR